jgi:hypothetical protein
MKERRSAHRTQWTAPFAVASELCKRGCQVALTLGNHPMIDLMVVSPLGRSFHVDVKGAYKRNFWVVHERPHMKICTTCSPLFPMKEQTVFSS